MAPFARTIMTTFLRTLTHRIPHLQLSTSIDQLHPHRRPSGVYAIEIAHLLVTRDDKSGSTMSTPASSGQAACETSTLLGYEHAGVNLAAEHLQMLARHRLADDACRVEFRFVDALRELTSCMMVETRLPEAQWQARQVDFVDRLVLQGRIQQRMERYPEIGASPLPPMVVITGQHRSGTTFLHNLLAAHNGLRAPSMWELMYPVDPTGEHPGERDRLRSRTGARVQQRYSISPEAKVARYLHQDLPDECRILMERAFRTPVDVTINRAYGYEKWLQSADMVGPYQYHAVQLQNILWRNPAQRIVLKSPTHMSALPALSAVYPDARIVMLHRDPLQTVPSMINFNQLLKPADLRYRNVVDDGAHLLDYLADSVERMMADRDGQPGLGPQILDVYYQDLIADPIDVVRQVAKFVDVAFSADDEAAVIGYVAENPQHKYGQHEYDLERIGTHAAEVERRFADYRKRYGF
jgi:hypothetical protein